MVTKEIEVVNKLGLHARPATMLVKTASGFKSKVIIKKDELSVDAKSIMGVLILAAQKGSRLIIEVEGPDEEAAADAMEDLFRRGFDED
ncbi:MAG TPA: HPr family phosphocarrier protein [candidate division Zixibacteria bacterium]|nr:HPr family phosphocarrier protein [candidate division Zixibacteria bacterium]